MRDYSAEDRRVRERLEKNSPQGTRADVVGMVNGLADQHASREMPGLGAYGVIRLLQDNGRHANEVRKHNLAHDEYLRRSTTAMPVNAGASFGEARLSPERRGPSGSRFDFHANDPGQVRGSRFEWAEGAPKLSAGRLRDAEGALRSDDPRAQDHFASGKISNAETVLSVEDLRHLMAQKWRSRFF